jgi:hypothetical protein
LAQTWIERAAAVLSAAVLVLTALSLAVPPVRGFLLERLKRRRKRAARAETTLSHIAERLGLTELACVTLLHDRLFNACTKALARGWTTTGEITNLHHLFDVYHKMGGNSAAAALYRRALTLPVRDLGGEEGGPDEKNQP